MIKTGKCCLDILAGIVLCDLKSMDMIRMVVYGSLVLCFCAFVGCAEEDAEPELGRACPVDAVEGSEDGIVGKWKMVWMRRGFSIDTVDFSCDNVIYHFRPDGILEVSSDVEGIGYVAGDYNYELIWDPYNSGATTFRGVKIDDFLRWACYIETTTMTLDITPLDGPMKHFIRIE